MTVTSRQNDAFTEDNPALSLRWLVQLRWAAIVGELGLMGVAEYALGLRLPLLALGLLAAIQGLSNLVALYKADATKRPEAWVTGLLLLDALLLTAMLYLTGGASNPFNFLYLVHLALASLMIRPVLVWVLTAVYTLLFGLLFQYSLPLSPLSHEMDHSHHEMGHAAGHTMSSTMDHDMDLHLQGMWVAFVIAAVFIVYFTTRLSTALRQRDRQLREAQAVAQRSAKLTALATLAGGAAHELSTPLSTIAVVANELQHADLSDDLMEDVILIRTQVDRCQHILRDLRADVGEAAGEPLTQTSLRECLEELRADLTAERRDRLALHASEHSIQTYPKSLRLALSRLVENAFDASGPSSEVSVSATCQQNDLHIEVRDEGKGMSAEILNRLGEPFFTTKSEGAGLGLGVHLARSVIENLGGEITFSSTSGVGTRATLTLPLPGSST